jgi:HAD superfamily hydrolase (TIGR01509 family)
MNEIKHKIKAIIFDMDGTIIKTEHIWENVTINTLKHCGVKELTQDQKNLIKTLSGIGLEKSTQFLKEKFNLTQSLKEIYDKKISLAEEYFENRIEFIEGFVDFHNKLKQNSIPTSIATNADPASLKKISKILSLENFFGHNMYCVADVNFVPKPDPALFLYSAAKLGAKPEDCVVFEDSIFGFNAAKAAGMKCIGIKNDLNQQYLDKVNDAIENYHQAEEILKKISK